MESIKLKSYLEELKKRKKEKPRERLAEIVEPFYPLWNWTDSTFFGDMTALWVALRRYRRWRTEAQLIALLKWTEGKNIHPRAVIKILNKK